MVFYEVTRGSSVGPIDRWSFTRQSAIRLWVRSTDGLLRGNVRDLFVAPINRWYFIVRLWDRSIDDPVL